LAAALELPAGFAAAEAAALELPAGLAAALELGDVEAPLPAAPALGGAELAPPVDGGAAGAVAPHAANTAEAPVASAPARNRRRERS
jgi:hypothetical protein